jgi:hypothetical protein
VISLVRISVGGFMRQVEVEYSVVNKVGCSPPSQDTVVVAAAPQTGT